VKHAFQAWVCCLGLVFAAPRVHAHSVSTEASASGGGYLAWGLVADLEISADVAYLGMAYGVSRADATDRPAHTLSLAADVRLANRWTILVGGNLSPSVTRALPITDRIAFRSLTDSVGLQAGLSFDTGGGAAVEWGVDASVSATRFGFRNQILGLARQFQRVDDLYLWRPSLGLTVVIQDATSLSLRGSYGHYTADPLSAGRFTDEELDALGDRLLASTETLAGERVAEQIAQRLGGRLMQLDAVSGLPSAPVWFDARLSVAHTFFERWRAELAYAFLRYVPTQGHGHILSTRQTVSLSRTWRLWAAVAGQWDVLEGGGVDSEILGTTGVELSF
jgi:hypothetical protein